VEQSEIVGLVPERAIWDAGARYLKLGEPVEPHLLEVKVRASLGPTLDGWIDSLAGAEPTPGGGSAAALAGALAAALAAMVGRLTSSRKAYAKVAPEFTALTEEAERLRLELRRLVDEDAAAYDAVMAAYQLPKGTGTEVKARQEAIDRALLTAAEVPLRTARAAARVAELARRAAQAGNQNAVADAGVAALLARAALTGARYNVEINVNARSQPKTGMKVAKEARTLERKGLKSATAAAAAVAKALKPRS
jgi:glutamate formiminotransferase/formiminotetrahydrofolate cyclodeaminase